MSTGVPSGDAASAVTLAGALRAGAAVSATSATCSAVAALPASSVAVQVMTVRPIGRTGGASPATEWAPAASEASGADRARPGAAAS